MGKSKRHCIYKPPYHQGENWKIEVKDDPPLQELTSLEIENKEKGSDDQGNNRGYRHTENFPEHNCKKTTAYR